MIELPKDASGLSESERFCNCCGKTLKGKIVWLELDQRTNTYHNFGDVPLEKSQGWFVFGSACAKNKIREAKNV